MAQLEKTVMTNAKKLDKIMGTLTTETGKYVVFNGKEYLVGNTFASAVDAGDKTYGEKSGFVVRKVGSALSLSHLVKK